MPNKEKQLTIHNNEGSPHQGLSEVWRGKDIRYEPVFGPPRGATSGTAGVIVIRVHFF